MAGAAIKENCGCVIKRVCVGLKDGYRALDPARQEDGVSGRKGGAMLIFVIMAAVEGAQDVPTPEPAATPVRSEEHTSELQSLMRISYAVFCLKKKIQPTNDKVRRNVRSARHSKETKQHNLTTIK